MSVGLYNRLCLRTRTLAENRRATWLSRWCIRRTRKRGRHARGPVARDVARGLVLLFGIGTRALPSWDSRTGWNNLMGGLAVKRSAGPSGHTNSPHPSSREGHHSTTRWNSSFLLSDLIFLGCHAAAAAC